MGIVCLLCKQWGYKWAKKKQKKKTCGVHKTAMQCKKLHKELGGGGRADLKLFAQTPHVK